MNKGKGKEKKDRTKREKKSEDFAGLSRRMLRYANRAVSRIEFINELSKMLLNFSNCDAVELRLTEGKFNYRFEAKRNGEGSTHFEIIPSIFDETGLPLPCSLDDSGIEQVCRSIASGKIKDTAPYFTPNGSFWITDSIPEASRNIDIIKLEKGYHSLAMIPFAIDEIDKGLLELKSRSNSFCSAKEVESYEGLAQALGIAVAGRRAHAALRERVKEITCLYEIAKLVERAGISLEEIIQGIADLLPAAFQHSNIASSRIILDGRVYPTRNYKHSRLSICSEVEVEGIKRGIVEVYYSEGKPELELELFLKEEQNLLDTVASQIALIIERRQSEEDRINLESQLRHADRLATLGQLAAGVAHELNEPLGGILGFAQLLQKTPGLPTQASDDIEKIVTASLHAREVVKKLLYFARQMPTVASEIDVNKIVSDGIYFLESRCAKEGIELVRQLDPSLPKIVADPAQIHQALVNLIVNAIQAMPQGGRLILSTKAYPDHISLVVEDAGTGMSDEVKKRIFLPFFTTKEVGHGTGLGLAVVHGIITSHGGRIKVESEQGKGSSFEIELPLNTRSLDEEKDDTP